MSAQDKLIQSAPPVVITGAHSGIGQQLIERLKIENIPVIGLVTPWCDQKGLHEAENLIEYVACDLSESLSNEIIVRCKNAEILVHLAWARPKKPCDAARDNVVIFDNILKALPTDIKTLYMSSVCATADNPSYYGQAKYHLAQMIATSRRVEIIAGLVKSEPAIGPFLALQNFVCGLHGAFKFLPSPAALVAHPDQVMDALIKGVLDFDSCDPVVIAYDPTELRLNDLIVEILKEKSVWGLPLPLPTKLILWALYMIRKLVPGVAITDRLITLLSVSPDALAKRIKAETGTSL